jgi:hypothetical protein
VSHMWQRLHVHRQQHQAWPRMDDQLVTSGAEVSPDGLATLKRWQTGSCIPLEMLGSEVCRAADASVVHCPDQLTS